VFNNERKSMRIRELLKSRHPEECPAKRISYAVIADTLRHLFDPSLNLNRKSACASLGKWDSEWLMSDKYGREVDKAGGCSFEYCCLCLDFDPKTFRDTVKLLLSNKRKYNQYIKILLNDLYKYNNIYYNIYNNNKL